MTTPVPVPAAAPVAVAPAYDLGAMIQVSEMLARSSLVPAAYRNRPENVLLATLAGQAYGWDPAMAMRSFHIIEGTPSLKPEIQLALVRRAGHSVTGETTPDGATVTGTRRDTGDTMTVTFTLEDAKRAGLLGRKGPWQQYPQSMCWARALSQLCRMLFPDAVLGAGYTPEELGGVAEVPEIPEAQPTGISSAQAKRQVLEAAGGDVDVARQVWADEVGEADTLTPEQLEAVCAAAADAQIVDADVLDGTEPLDADTEVTV